MINNQSESIEPTQPPRESWGKVASVSELFEGRNSSLFNTFQAAVKTSTSERAELVKFWIENVRDKKGKKYRPAFIAMKLSLYSVKDLYYLQSVAKDYENRGGSVGKYFWSLFKPK